MSLNRNRNGCAISAAQYFDRYDLPGAPCRSSFTEARSKIAWEAFPFLLNKINDTAPEKLWKGHRVFAIDGSRIILPHSKEILEEFPKRTTHYPKGLLVAVTDVFSGCVKTASLDQEYSSERDHLERVSFDLAPNSIALLDRGFDGFDTWFKLDQKNIKFVCRIRSQGNLPKYMTNFISSKIKDQCLQITSKEGKTLNCRLIRKGRDRRGKVIVLVTNLTEVKMYKRIDLWKLYKKRWGIETQYYRMKKLLCLETFRSKTLNGVLQEVWANLITLSLCSLSTFLAQSNQKALQKISFKNSIEVLSKYIHCFVWSDLGKEIIQEIMSRLKKIKYTQQPGRKNPRVSKQTHQTWVGGKKNILSENQLKRKGWY